MGEGSVPVDCEKAAAARRLQQKTVLITALIDTLVANYISKACRYNPHSQALGPVRWLRYPSYRFPDLSRLDLRDYNCVCCFRSKGTFTCRCSVLRQNYLRVVASLCFL